MAAVTLLCVRTKAGHTEVCDGGAEMVNGGCALRCVQQEVKELRLTAATADQHQKRMAVQRVVPPFRISHLPLFSSPTNVRDDDDEDDTLGVVILSRIKQGSYTVCNSSRLLCIVHLSTEMYCCVQHAEAALVATDVSLSPSWLV